jgi:hypothetical protein
VLPYKLVNPKQQRKGKQMSEALMRNMLTCLEAIQAQLESIEAQDQRNSKALMATMILVTYEQPPNQETVDQVTEVVDMIYANFNQSEE